MGYRLVPYDENTKTDFKNKAYKENYPTHPCGHKNASYIHIEKTATLPGGHVFPLITTIFKLIQHINKTNVLTNFHDDWPTKCYFESKMTPTPGDHVTRWIKTIFELKRKNLLTKCHDDWAKNVSSRLGNCPTPWRPCFFTDLDFFKLNQDIHKTNVLTKFHDDWTKYVTYRVKKTPPPGSYETHVLTKFHKDWAKNMSSRLFTFFSLYTYRLNCPIPWRPYIHITNAKNVTSRKTAPPPGRHVFSPIWTIFKLVRDINETNVLTEFHDDWAKIVTSRVFTINTAPPPGGHVFQWTETIFEPNQHIIKTNILTKLHEDWASNVTSTVFTNFKLGPGIIGTNVLTKFHEDRTINVASRVFTRQMLTTDVRRKTNDGQMGITIAHHKHVVLR
ncbi:hypothetical protein DPMN_000176 [Dreissena polymorpha]|uniref:Uncharacterized protein n=1 Tax=Dreissena polymorpha TaxID=45954 RepID=A0A9D4MEW4_DREPO|nr:hypothetical protein DPMN_000176 [Dreissena polymorpha]